MLVSTILGSPLVGISSTKGVSTRSNEGMMVVECSSRPQKKATAHHMKTRPKKTRPSEVNKKPAVYPPLPVLPSEWTLVQPATAVDSGAQDHNAALSAAAE